MDDNVDVPPAIPMENVELSPVDHMINRVYRYLKRNLPKGHAFTVIVLGPPPPGTPEPEDKRLFVGMTRVQGTCHMKELMESMRGIEKLEQESMSDGK